MTAILGMKGVVISKQDWIELIGDDAYLTVRKTFNRRVPQKHGYKNGKLVSSDIIGGNTFHTINRFQAFKYLERGYLQTINSILPDGETISDADWGLSHLQPYPIQQTVFDYIMTNYFTDEMAATGRAGLTLELEAGLGKTFVAAMIAYRLKLKTLYVVPNEFLLNQGIKDFRACFPDLRIGCYYAKKKCDGDVIFMIVNSVTSASFTFTDPSKNATITLTPKQYFRRFGLSIWDEAHEYATSERAKAMVAATTKYVMGVTAEATHREDNMDFIVHSYLGPVVQADKIPGFELPDEDRYHSRVRMIHYVGPREYTANLINESTGMMACHKMSRQAIQDPYRTHLIINEAKKLYDAGHNFFIWCDMREIVMIIKEILCKSKLFDPADIGAPEEDDNGATSNIAHLMGGTTPEEIAIAQQSRIIIATYQYAYRGVSLPKFDAMIFATPRRAKIYQTLKRIFRMGGDVEIERQIIDIVDAGTKLKNQLTSRRTQYKRDIFGMKMIREQISHGQIIVPLETMQLYNAAIDNHLDEESRIF